MIKGVFRLNDFEKLFLGFGSMDEALKEGFISCNSYFWDWGQLSKMAKAKF